MKKHILLIVLIFLGQNSLLALELSGTVISDNEKIITSRFMGYIKKVHVNEGDFVKKGQLLYEIDSSNIDSKKQEVELNLQIQKNNLENLEINYQRYKRLYEKDLVPKYDVEQLKLKIDNTKNMISILKAKEKEVNYQYNYIKIVAPNNGLIIKKNIKTGEMSMPSAPAFVLSDLDSLKIKTQINESNLKNIKIGTKALINIESLDFISQAKVVSIIPNIQDMTHSFIVKLSFEKKKQKIYPGMYTKIKLELENEQ